MFKKIAVALDASESGREAFDVALQLAEAEHAEIGICSVVDPITIAGTSPPSPAMDTIICEMETGARRLITDAVERANQAGITACGQVRTGAPAFEVLAYAERFGADLIVMGTHGRRGFKHFLLGSVAEVVLRESKNPVLVVRAQTAKSKAA